MTFRLRFNQLIIGLECEPPRGWIAEFLRGRSGRPWSRPVATTAHGIEQPQLAQYCFTNSAWPHPRVFSSSSPKM